MKGINLRGMGDRIIRLCTLSYYNYKDSSEVGTRIMREKKNEGRVKKKDNTKIGGRRRERER